MAATKAAVNQLIQTLMPQQAPTRQTSAQPQAPTAQPNPLHLVYLCFINVEPTLSYIYEVVFLLNVQCLII